MFFCLVFVVVVVVFFVNTFKKVIKINSDINISAFQLDSINKEDVTFKVSLMNSLHIEVLGICLVLLLT